MKMRHVLPFLMGLATAVVAVQAADPKPVVPPAPTAATSKVQDRLELDSTQITGNVVPWRRPDLGEFAGKPPNSLLDELLQPVDREVFRRQNRYFAALQPDAAAAASASGDRSPSGVKDEK
jgi:hypothetical protein